MLLRNALGETLRHTRMGQKRTLRDVSTIANVSLGYLSEVERGQKEASSELLSAICEALEIELSDVLSSVSSTMRTTAPVTAAASPRREIAAGNLRIVLPYRPTPSAPSIV